MPLVWPVAPSGAAPADRSSMGTGVEGQPGRPQAGQTALAPLDALTQVLLASYGNTADASEARLWARHKNGGCSYGGRRTSRCPTGSECKAGYACRCPKGRRRTATARMQACGMPACAVDLFSVMTPCARAAHARMYAPQALSTHAVGCPGSAAGRTPGAAAACSAAQPLSVHILSVSDAGDGA